MALQKVVRNMLNTGISDSSDATAITIDSSENVTIGTVGSGASTATPVELNLGSTFADGVGNAKTKLKLFEDSSANVYGFGVSNNLLEYHAAASGEHAFYVNDSEKVRIDSSGHVGIGMTPAPVGSDTVLSIYNSATPRIKLHNSTTGTSSSDGGEINMSSSDLIIENREAGNQRFFTNGAEHMRIDSAGTLYLGTTSPTLHSAQTGIVFENGSLLTDTPRAASRSINLAQNAAVDSGNTWAYLSTDEASLFQQFNGHHYFKTAASGSAGADVSFDTKMFIDNGGSVGIGTTSPDGHLHIHKASAGSVTAYSDSNLVIETDQSNNFLSFLSPAAANQGILFGDADANWRGQIQYNHANDQMILYSGATARMYINSNGRIGIGTTGGNAGLHVANADIRCSAAAVANDANSISMSQESANNSYIVSRGNSTSERGNIYLTVSRSNGGGGINGLIVASDGSVSKNSGSFKIDHPLESKKDTHHLVHSFVEGPQADNMYRGVVELENGTATINLDTVSGMTEGTFVALNTDIQCFTSNETDWDSVKGSISGNTLTISCQNTSSTATVSWLVIGERQDQHMLDADWTNENGKVIVEPLKESE